MRVEEARHPLDARRRERLDGMKRLTPHFTVVA
jgi:hypothetical protein